MHFKLFEEFSNNFAESKFYRQVAELPESGFIDSEDEEKLEIMQLALFKAGYTWSGNTEVVTKKDLDYISRDVNDPTFYWHVLKSINKKKIVIFSPGLKIPPGEIDFDKYFEPKEKYTGYHAGKKYGI